MVILTTPPGFRPLHFEQAIAAQKHVFMEKPVAVDGPGVRRVLAAGQLAKSKGLAVAVGLQRHHEPRYIETVRRLHDGSIGEILALRVYWKSDGVWTRNRKPGQTEMEYQLNNWYYFNWLCGDHIVEQHIHNLDVGNWVKGSYPISAVGFGGRQVRKGQDHGQIFDHHSVEFTYADGCKMFSQCCHIPGCESAVAEFAHGSRGSADISAGRIYDAKGALTWEYAGDPGNGYQQEHRDLVGPLRAGEIVNEVDYAAMSTMTAVLGRMATYSARSVEMQRALEHGPSLARVDDYKSFSDTPPVLPDAEGRYPIAEPGVTDVFA